MQRRKAPSLSDILLTNHATLAPNFSRGRAARHIPYSASQRVVIAIEVAEPCRSKKCPVEVQIAKHVSRHANPL